MALNASQKTKLSRILVEYARNQSVIDGRAPNDIIQMELFLAFFENDTQRTARATIWINAVKAARQTNRDAADAVNTSYKSALDADIAEMNTVATNL